MKHIVITESPYFAKGDGVTNDREIIQQAIDDLYLEGGGTVELTAGRTFLSGGIVLRSNITLLFGDGATLLQSLNPKDYVKPKENGYEPYTPLHGNRIYEHIKWSHGWYYNYPFIYSAKGNHDVKVTGKGTIFMNPDDEPEKILHVCPIGFFRTENFEISDITITNYHSYAIMSMSNRKGLFKNIKINKWSHGNGDGICLQNCQDIRVTGCDMYSGDDSLYIWSSYSDPRKSEWWNSDDPQPSMNIEIDHNNLRSHYCKAFGMILWGIDCPDLEKIEVRNVYVHDNHIVSLGVWLYNPYTLKTDPHPVTNFKFENNKIDAIEQNFFDTQVSDMDGFRSMMRIRNGDFKDGLVYWNYLKNDDENSVGRVRGEENYGYIKHLEKGDAKLYEGLYIENKPAVFRAEVRSSGDKCRLFIRSKETNELIAYKDFTNTEWERLEIEFTVPESGNYLLGIERGEALKGEANIKNAYLYGNYHNAYGYNKAILDEGKLIYVYNEDNLDQITLYRE